MMANRPDDAITTQGRENTMRSHGLGMIAAIACASLGIPGLASAASDGTVRRTPRTPSRKPGQPHSCSREIARRQRQEAKHAARAGA